MIMIRPSDKVYIEISSSFDRFDNFIKNITILKWAKTYKNLTNIADHRNKNEKKRLATADLMAKQIIFDKTNLFSTQIAYFQLYFSKFSHPS